MCKPERYIYRLLSAVDHSTTTKSNQETLKIAILVQNYLHARISAEVNHGSDKVEVQ